jgi:D-beta-D-heptose 7-phosphate kinase/D-beta-D-heptose 1-phosphate adenosyltransferase
MDRSLQSILARFARQRILVVGDVMLDEYIWGAVRRISPEAPVPIVELQKRSDVPGGAANAAANVLGLGGVVHLMGLVGGDEAGQRLRKTLAAQGIDLRGLLTAENRPTTTKTRIIAHNQHVVRVDHEYREPVPPVLEEQLLGLIDVLLPQVDACILSDYAKGLVSHTVARHVIQQATALGKPIVVDPKGSDYSRFHGATLVKPNQHEAGVFLRRQLDSPEDVSAAGRQLLAYLGSAAVLITHGAAGMTLFEEGNSPVHIPAQAREVYDVTGAGDTVAGTLAMALPAGASLEQAARLASQAAGIIVGRVGTTPVRLEDLLTSDEQ